MKIITRMMKLLVKIVTKKKKRKSDFNTLFREPKIDNVNKKANFPEK